MVNECGLRRYRRRYSRNCERAGASGSCGGCGCGGPERVKARWCGESSRRSAGGVAVETSEGKERRFFGGFV